MSSHWLENLYWGSQVVLAVVAVLAAVAAYLQIRTYKLHEVLKHLEADEHRAARRIVLRELYFRKDQDWWDNKKNGERWEIAASDVCAMYDVMALLIQQNRLARMWGGYGRFFKRYWASSIVDTYDVLKRFIAHRRTRAPIAYQAFVDLATELEKTTPVPSIPPN